MILIASRKNLTAMPDPNIYGGEFSTTPFMQALSDACNCPNTPLQKGETNVQNYQMCAHSSIQCQT